MHRIVPRRKYSGMCVPVSVVVVKRACVKFSYLGHDTFGVGGVCRMNRRSWG